MYVASICHKYMHIYIHLSVSVSMAHKYPTIYCVANIQHKADIIYDWDTFRPDRVRRQVQVHDCRFNLRVHTAEFTIMTSVVHLSHANIFIRKIDFDFRFVVLKWRRLRRHWSINVGSYRFRLVENGHVVAEQEGRAECHNKRGVHQLPRHTLKANHAPARVIAVKNIRHSKTGLVSFLWQVVNKVLMIWFWESGCDVKHCYQEMLSSHYETSSNLRPGWVRETEAIRCD